MLTHFNIVFIGMPRLDLSSIPHANVGIAFKVSSSSRTNYMTPLFMRKMSEQAVRICWFIHINERKTLEYFFKS